MGARVPLSAILELLESQGWRLQRIAPPYRIFTKGDNLPILIPVHGKMVDAVYVGKINKILREEGENE